MPRDRSIDLHFPKAGIDISKPAGEWPRRVNNDTGEVHYTCADGQNVRGFDSITRRNRGGSRPGTAKYVPSPTYSNWLVQDVNVLVGVGYNPPGGGALQPSQSGRVVTVVAVNRGNIYVANPGDTAWTAPTNNSGITPALNFTGLVFSSAMRQKLYFVDGIASWCYYDPSTNTVENWVATAGAFPADGSGNTPRLICTWRGRLILSGLFEDPQNIFMSKIDDANDWDYSPQNPSALDAIALNLSEMGLIGDVVTGLVPMSDDVLVVLGDHTVFKITGDPLSGGVVDRVSDGIGAAWGQAWCKGPDGTLYFFSNIPGVYALAPEAAGKPYRISGPIDPLLREINTGTHTVSMAWDDDAMGFHVFVTLTNSVDEATHYFFEAPRPDGSGGAWWKDVFAQKKHNPLCCCTVDGNEVDDRCVVIGSWDGYVRRFDRNASTDDGVAIESFVKIGPLLTPNLDEVILENLQGVFAEDSADVDLEIQVGRTAEIAVAATPLASVSDTFSSSRGYTKYVNRAGHAIYVGLRSTGRWAMESIRAGIAATLSKVRGRRKGG